MPSSGPAQQNSGKLLSKGCENNVRFNSDKGSQATPAVCKQHPEFSPPPCGSLGKGWSELEGLRAPPVGHSSELPTLASAQFSQERKDPTAQTAGRTRLCWSREAALCPWLCPGLLGLLTCQGATVTSLQHHSQAEKGKGQVEIPVLRELHSHVATVHLRILFCRGNSQVPQVTLPQAWMVGRGNSESADRAAQSSLGLVSALWHSQALPWRHLHPPGPAWLLCWLLMELWALAPAHASKCTWGSSPG